MCVVYVCFFFFFQAEDGIRDLTVTGVQTCALPISVEPAASLERLPSRQRPRRLLPRPAFGPEDAGGAFQGGAGGIDRSRPDDGDPGHACGQGDRKSTRLNSSHSQISYAVFCLKKKKKRTK